MLKDTPHSSSSYFSCLSATIYLCNAKVHSQLLLLLLYSRALSPLFNMLTIINDSDHSPCSCKPLHPCSQGVDVQALGGLVLASVVLQ